MISFPRPSQRPVAVAVAVGAAALVGTGLVLLPAVHSRLWLAAGLVIAVGVHVFAARGVKAVLASTAPLASGAPESAGYARSVYGTPGAATGQIVGLVLLAGLLLGFGVTLGWGWLSVAALVTLAAAVGLDLQRWERVAVSADWVWFQRGFAQKVHQVAIENIRDISVQEEDVDGVTLRHGTRNRVCRLNLRMHDKRIVALPKTDAFADLDDVESVANHIRARQALMEGLAKQRGERSSAPPHEAPAEVSPDEADRAMQRELRRLRRAAMGQAATPAPRETRVPPKS